MCEVCGCGEGAATTGVNLQTGKPVAMAGEGHGVHVHEHVHADGTRHVHAHGAHPHDHVHAHAHGAHVHAGGVDHVHSHAADGQDHAPATLVEVETRVLAKNDALAARNRAWLAERRAFALNLMSAPGAGKTTLLERTIRDMKGRMRLLVLEGDQATTNDGERIRAAGAAAVQVNTGTGCHLDADMVARGLAELDPGEGSLVVIENVGNLVCPALFDLGEHAKVVVLSVTEGDDKPVKYPHMFRAAQLMLLNKIDLLPHVEFDVSRAVAGARAVNPDLSVLTLSARTGEGLEAWYAWLRQEMAAVEAAKA